MSGNRSYPIARPMEAILIRTSDHGDESKREVIRNLTLFTLTSLIAEHQRPIMFNKTDEGYIVEIVDDFRD